MKILLTLVLLLFVTMLGAQNAPDEVAIRKLDPRREHRVEQWGCGSLLSELRYRWDLHEHFGDVLHWSPSFLDRHEEIFKGMFRGTVARQDIVSVKFVRADVAVVETLTWISGFSKSGPPPGAHMDAKGRLCTRLLQVLVRDGGKWSIASYHNTDVKPGTPVPEPK